MPTGTLPKSAKALWEKVYNAAKAKGDKPAKAAKKAWGAVKNAGWSKDAKGKWTKKAQLLTEFSMAITKASYDKATGERRWVATCSDTDLDLYGDKMSMELFADFCDRIQKNEQAPEEFRSEFWSGGMPYLSVSHYPDLDGLAVPGPVDGVFVDGNKFKSKGRFADTPLGIAAYETIKKDITEKSPNPVRISIAFLDYKHKHLSNDYVFERSLDDPKKMICPECLKEAITDDYGGKEFLRGMLVHEAMTRVPVNQRTDMEVERAMTTRKEDAASIIGDELAEEIEDKAKLVGKSEALVIKADETEEVVETPEEEELVEVPFADEDEDKVLAELAELKSQISELISVLKGKGDKKAMKDDEEEKDDSPDEEDEEYKDKKKKKEQKSEVVEEPQVDPVVAIAEAFKSALMDTNQRLDILISAMSQNVTSSGVPQRRSMTPPPNYMPPVPPVQTAPGAPQSITDFVRRSVG